MPDERTVLFIKPIFDDLAITYLVLTDPIRDAARKLGYNVIALEGRNATPEAVDAAIADHDPLIVFSCGHGCAQVTTLVDYKDVFWTEPGCSAHSHISDNLARLEGRFVFLLSCLCGQRLVPDMIEAGAKTAVGYVDEFLWVVDTEHPPKEDVFAETFFDPPNTFMQIVLEGGGLQQAYDGMADRYAHWVDHWEVWLRDNPDADAYTRSRASLTVDLLEHDLQAFTLLGEDLQISPRTVMKMGLPTVAAGLVAGWGLLWWLQNRK